MELKEIMYFDEMMRRQMFGPYKLVINCYDSKNTHAKIRNYLKYNEYSYESYERNIRGRVIFAFNVFLIFKESPTSLSNFLENKDVFCEIRPIKEE
jgi:hypothetical protein